jgi:hypothetical protein
MNMFEPILERPFGMSYLFPSGHLIVRFLDYELRFRSHIELARLAGLLTLYSRQPRSADISLSGWGQDVSITREDLPTLITFFEETVEEAAWFSGDYEVSLDDIHVAMRRSTS